MDKLIDICEESREIVKMVKKVNREYHNIFTIAEDEERIHNTLMEEAKTTGFNEGIEQGIEKGIEQGIEQGEKNKTIELVKNMLNVGISISQIIDITKMTKEEIFKIKNNIE